MGVCTMNKRFGMREQYFVAILLGLVVTAVYLRAVTNGFTNYDDDKYVLENVTIHAGPTLKGIIWAFTAFYQSNWHPLTWISHMFDCWLYGPKPAGHHFTNLVLHVAAMLMLYAVFVRMTGSPWKSGFVAGLFGLHPLHVESAAWVAERKDVLSAFFWMLTMWVYAWYAELKSAGSRLSNGVYALVIAIFALGLMAKPMLVTLPFVLLLLDYWPLGRLKTLRGEQIHSLIVEKIPLFVLTFASCVVTYHAQHREGAVRTLEQFPLGVRAANALVAYVVYIRKMFWPVDLAALYPHPGSHLPVWTVFVSSLVIVVLTGAALVLARRHRYVAVGWLWYLGTLVPVIGLVQVGEQALADRYTYVTLIGLFIIFAWGVPELLRSGKSLSNQNAGFRCSPVITTSGFLSLTVLAGLTYVQIGYWKDSETLFRHTLAYTRGNEIAHNNYGIALAALGRTTEAMAHFRRAIELSPQYPDPHGNLGNIYDSMGRLDDAIKEYEAVLKLNPGDARAYYNLGNVLAKKGKAKEAMEQYDKSLEKSRNNAGAHINRGKMFAAQGKIEQAIREYQAAIKANPLIAEAHYNLGLAYKRQNRLDEALKEYHEAIRLEPKWPAPHNNLANVLLLQKKYDEAISEYKEAIRLNPAHAEAHNNLAAAYMYVGRYADAWKEIRLARKYGFNPSPLLIEQLSKKMPEPK